MKIVDQDKMSVTIRFSNREAQLLVKMADISYRSLAPKAGVDGYIKAFLTTLRKLLPFDVK